MFDVSWQNWKAHSSSPNLCDLAFAVDYGSCKQLFGLHWIGWNKKPAYHIAHACFVLLLAVSFCLLTCHTIWETTDFIRDFYWTNSNSNFQYFSNRKEHVIWVVKAIFRFNNTKNSFRLKSSPVICTIRPQDNETKVV